MSNLTCLHCTADTNGVVLCSRCQTTAGKALSNISAYHADLFSLPAQTFGLRRSNRVSDPTGSAVSLAAASDPIEDAVAATRNLLATWVRVLLDDRPQLHAPADHVEAMGRLLGQQVRSIATLEWAGEFLREVLALELRLRRIVEANKGRWYAGVCGTVLDPETGVFCTRVLYADPEVDHVWCPVCRTTWPVRDRRLILLEQARDVETNIAVIARAALALLDGEPSAARLEARIQKWADRGKLERRGHVDLDGHVRKVYRVGDVLDLLLADSRSSAFRDRSA